MNVNFDDYKGPMKFEGGKRYSLVVAGAEEGTSAIKGTPYLRLKLETEDLRDAGDHDIWLTAKALGFAMEWFRALGLPDKGNVSIPADEVDQRLRGIHLSAECYLEPYKINEGTDEEKTLYNTKWTKPERVTVGAAKAEKPAEKPAANPITEKVPF